MSDRSDRGRDGDRGGPPRAAHGVWHWVTAALGLLLLVATIAFLVHDGMVRRRTPHPVLTVSVDTVAATAGGHVVRVRVRNDGGVAASNVGVRGEIRGADGVIEMRETSLDYVPPMSAREAGLVFERDPRAAGLAVGVTSFDLP